MTINKDKANREENIIMIAEDDRFIRLLEHEAVKSMGRIIEVENAKQVIEKYIQYNPDVLFLDIHLPGGDGLKILEDLVEYDKDSHIVIVSADSIEDNIIYTSQHGAKAFVTKPFTKEKLIETVESCPTYKKPE